MGVPCARQPARVKARRAAQRSSSLATLIGAAATAAPRGCAFTCLLVSRHARRVGALLAARRGRCAGCRRRHRAGWPNLRVAATAGEQRAREPRQAAAPRRQVATSAQQARSAAGTCAERQRKCHDSCAKSASPAASARPARVVRIGVDDRHQPRVRRAVGEHSERFAVLTTRQRKTSAQNTSGARDAHAMRQRSARTHLQRVARARAGARRALRYAATEATSCERQRRLEAARLARTHPSVVQAARYQRAAHICARDVPAGAAQGKPRQRSLARHAGRTAGAGPRAPAVHAAGGVLREDQRLAEQPLAQLLSERALAPRVHRPLCTVTCERCLILRSAATKPLHACGARLSVRDARRSR